MKVKVTKVDPQTEGQYGSRQNILGQLADGSKLKIQAWGVEDQTKLVGQTWDIFGLIEKPPFNNMAQWDWKKGKVTVMPLGAVVGPSNTQGHIVVPPAYVSPRMERSTDWNDPAPPYKIADMAPVAKTVVDKADRLLNLYNFFVAKGVPAAQAASLASTVFINESK